MAVAGCLGEMIFEVSSETVLTIDDMKWSGSANFSTHQRHLGNALTEFTGLDPDEISFNIILSVYLGANPMDEMVKLWNYQRNGTPVSLVIGSHAYGKYKWNITSHDIKAKTFSPDGDITTATVSVTLQEYLKK